MGMMTNKTFPASTRTWWSNSPVAAFKLIACLILFSASTRGADSEASPTPDPIDQRVKDLIEKSNGSTAAMVEAAGEGYHLWDQELNRVYQELMRKLPPEDQAILKESQQEWIKFRDSNQRLIGEVRACKRDREPGYCR